MPIDRETPTVEGNKFRNKPERVNLQLRVGANHTQLQVPEIDRNFYYEEGAEFETPLATLTFGATVGLPGKSFGAITIRPTLSLGHKSYETSGTFDREYSSLWLYQYTFSMRHNFAYFTPAVSAEWYAGQFVLQSGLGMQLTMSNKEKLYDVQEGYLYRINRTGGDNIGGSPWVPFPRPRSFSQCFREKPPWPSGIMYWARNISLLPSELILNPSFRYTIT